MRRDFDAGTRPVLGSRRERAFQQKNARRITAAARYKRPEVPNAAYRAPGRGVSGESTN